MCGKKKFIFLASLSLNFIAFFVFCGILYIEQDVVKNKLSSFFTSTKNVENLAKSMNQEVFSPEFGKVANGDSVLKIAFVGNSITLHGVAENIGWTHKSGMAASTLDNDYVHKLVKKIAMQKNISVEYAVINAASFERNFESFDKNRLEKIKNFIPDYVIFQLGENVSSAKLKNENEYDLFVGKYVEFISEFNESKKIVCLPFWYEINKVSAITEAALKTNAFIVDLSHLGAKNHDYRNYAASEIKYSHKGVGLHPGDYGMENISNNIFSVFNALMN